MKTLFKGLLIAAAAVSSLSLHAQVSVEADGCVKMGNLNNARNASGNSLDVAVNKVYMYMAPNGSGSFSIYNNSKDEGGVIVSPPVILGESPAKAMDNVYNQPTVVEPLNAGRLLLGTSKKPLGSVYAGTVYGSGQQLTSDRRAKRNIRSLENTTSYLLSLKPVRFDFNREVITVEADQASDKIGFIAQDVRTVLPELIHYDTLSDLYSMDYVSLIPVLTKGFQEQDSVIRRQQALLEAQAELIAGLAEQLNDLQALLVSEKPASSPKKTPVANAKGQQNVLYQNTPNPFNQETRIRYELSKEARTARIVLYDMNGLQLKVYDLPLQAEGSLVLQAGSLPAGIYLYGLVVDGVQVDLKRMMVLMD